VYRDKDFQGPFAHIRPGFYTGRDLVGFRSRSAYGSGEDLDNAISSIRVGPNTIAALYRGTAPSASSGARVLVGPYDVSDLGSLGMDDSISAIQVLSFKEYGSGIPRSGGVILYGGYQGDGQYAVLERGDYNSARLASEEVKFPKHRLRSIRASPNVIAILYAGPDFDASDDAVVVVGPTLIGDLGNVGMADRVSSVRVLYTDPYDTPARPSTTIGTTRAYFPGGTAGYIPPDPAYRPPGPSPPRPIIAKNSGAQESPRASPYIKPRGIGQKAFMTLMAVLLVVLVIFALTTSMLVVRKLNPGKATFSAGAY
jgi:hypothetical protein